MRVITKNSMAVLIAIAVSGCNGDMLEMQSVDGMVPVEVKNVLSVDADITESRAGSPISTDGEKIGVFRIKGSGFDATDNVEYTYSSSTNKWTSTTPILVGYQAANLCAYYPYNSVTFTTGPTATLEATKYEAGKDMSYASSAGTTVTNQNPETTFAMNHAYARIKLAIKRSEINFIGNCNISTVNLRNNKNFYANRTLNISTGSYGGSVSGGGWTYTLDSGNMDVGSTNNEYDVLVPPQPVNSGLTITLVVDGSERSATIPAASFSSNLTAGSQYSISLVLSDIEVIPQGNVNIEDWVSDKIPIDVVEKYMPPKGSVIKVPSSEINLGGAGCTSSDKIYLGSLSWAGANIQSLPTGQNYWGPNGSGNGNYYVWMSSVPSGSANNATDPCSELIPEQYGYEWRLPTKIELEMLSRCTDKQVKGNGILFLNSTKGLYLPFAGHRDKDGGYEPTVENGVVGYYWASDNLGAPGPVSLRISDTGDVSFANHASPKGLSVRCVRGPEK